MGEKYKEHEDTSRLWCLAVLNTAKIEDVSKIIGKYIELRDNDPDMTLKNLDLQARRPDHE